MPPISLMIKPSSGMCNLRCRYCFYHDLTKQNVLEPRRFMAEETLEQVLRKTLEAAEGECTIAYQGGEPTLIGLEFYQKSVELQCKYNKKNVKIYNALQTNGVGLNSKWAEFFSEHRFLVGLSLDGTSETHDAYRRDAAGRGTFEQVLKTAKLFDRYGVDYNILTVVHAQTAGHAEEIYRFYQQNGFRYLQFIPCLDPLGEVQGNREYSLTANAYGAFLKTLFDLWYRDLRTDRAVSIREFDNYIQMLLGYPPESCSMGGRCSTQYVVESDGSVYPCDFYVLERYRLGSLRQNSFEELDRRREALGFLDEAKEPDQRCRTCRYYSLCRGGCKRYREPFQNGSYQRNVFCEAYREFFSYAAARMLGLARQLAGVVR